MDDEATSKTEPWRRLRSLLGEDLGLGSGLSGLRGGWEWEKGGEMPSAK